MNEEPKCTELGCMTPAQVVQCAEGSNTECWVAATMIAEDGSEVAYECCGGGGKKARFSLLRKGSPPQTVTPAEVPNSLTWIQRTI
jgi:hypothetical protein